MKQPLRVLILDDSAADAELMEMQLSRAGFHLDCTVVDAEAEFAARLDAPLDLVLADYNLPRFDVFRALDMLAARALDVPLIVVTGHVEAETAARCIERGAAGCFSKDAMDELGLAVRRVLRAS
jgi:CheY-like chemotaxis protein